MSEMQKGSMNMAKKKNKGKKNDSAKSVVKVLISIVYIAWGIYAPIEAFGALVALDVVAMISAGVGVLTLLAGIFGLFGLEKGKCRAFGIIIFIFSIVGVIVALPALSVSTIITAILAWLFIICV